MPNAKLCQLVILIIVAGCTAQRGKDNANAAGADVQCHAEQLTGSMLGKTVCTTKAQRDAQQAAAADLQRASAAGGGGCRTNGALACQ